jgi:hypothetical protein
MIKYIEIKPATQKGKKLQAIFYDSNKKKIQTIPFGSAGMSDYTLHKDPKRKERYLDRHRAREDWTKPNNAGSLSRFLLWNKTTLDSSIKDYLKRFGLRKI